MAIPARTNVKAFAAPINFFLLTFGMTLTMSTAKILTIPFKSVSMLDMIKVVARTMVVRSIQEGVACKRSVKSATEGLIAWPVGIAKNPRSPTSMMTAKTMRPAPIKESDMIFFVLGA